VNPLYYPLSDSVSQSFAEVRTPISFYWNPKDAMMVSGPNPGYCSASNCVIESHKCSKEADFRLLILNGRIQSWLFFSPKKVVLEPSRDVKLPHNFKSKIIQFYKIETGRLFASFGASISL